MRTLKLVLVWLTWCAIIYCICAFVGASFAPGVWPWWLEAAFVGLGPAFGYYLVQDDPPKPRPLQ